MGTETLSQARNLSGHLDPPVDLAGRETEDTGARVDHRLDRRLRVYMAPNVLVVDEFGIWPCDRDAATAFFALVSARYTCPELAAGSVAVSS